MAAQAPGRSVSALLKGGICQESPHRAELGRGAGSAGRLAILLEPSTGGAAGNAELGLLEIVPGALDRRGGGRYRQNWRSWFSRLGGDLGFAVERGRDAHVEDEGDAVDEGTEQRGL